MSAISVPASPPSTDTSFRSPMCPAEAHKNTSTIGTGIVQPVTRQRSTVECPTPFPGPSRTDAEHLPRNLREAEADGEVVLGECGAHELRAVPDGSLGELDHGEGVRVPARVAAEELEPPGLDGAAGALGQARVAGDAVVDPLLGGGEM